MVVSEEPRSLHRRKGDRYAEEKIGLERFEGYPGERLLRIQRIDSEDDQQENVRDLDVF
jgi:hypothetical protein